MESPGKRIFIIGFMGSGKSTAGKKLASHLKWTFTDLDEEVEKKTGMKLPVIFSEKGEAFFRTIESEALHDQVTVNNVVISTGGGTPCSGNNMNLMLETGLTVYLRLSPAQLYSRLIGSSGERPLLNGIGKEDLKGFIIRKLEEREIWYSKAAIKFNAFETDISVLFPLVKNWIQKGIMIINS